MGPQGCGVCMQSCCLSCCSCLALVAHSPPVPAYTSSICQPDTPLPPLLPLLRQAALEPCSIQHRKLNTISLEPGAGQLLATSCTDGSIAIWDVRRLSGGAGRPGCLPAWLLASCC